MSSGRGSHTRSLVASLTVVCLGVVPCKFLPVPQSPSTIAVPDAGLPLQARQYSPNGFDMRLILPSRRARHHSRSLNIYPLDNSSPSGQTLMIGAYDVVVDLCGREKLADSQLFVLLPLPDVSFNSRCPRVFLPLQFSSIALVGGKTCQEKMRKASVTRWLAVFSGRG